MKAVDPRELVIPTAPAKAVRADEDPARHVGHENVAVGEHGLPHLVVPQAERLSTGRLLQLDLVPTHALEPFGEDDGERDVVVPELLERGHRQDRGRELPAPRVSARRHVAERITTREEGARDDLTSRPANTRSPKRPAVGLLRFPRFVALGNTWPSRAPRAAHHVSSTCRGLRTARV
jgi:hypothetical protein